MVAGMAPMVVPSHGFGVSGKPGANDRIRLAGIGVGRRGSTLLERFAGFEEVDIVAVADVDRKQAEQMANTHNAKAYHDYRRILDRDDIDAIVTATPDHWRALVCIHACQAGKDVYAEKPLTLTIAEGRQIVEAARKYDIVFQTGSQQRSMPANHHGCELIRNGRLGKVRKVIAHNYPSPWLNGLPGKPIPKRLDWEAWCGPAEVIPYDPNLERPRANPGWISFRAFSGGEMTGWGSHGFDQIQWALGMDTSGPVEIWTDDATFAPPLYTEPKGRSDGEKATSSPKVYMRYSNGVEMELADAPPGGGIFIGEHGRITIGRNSLESDPPELIEEPLKNKQVHLYKSDNHYKNWLDCIKSRETPIAEAETGHRSATICHLANNARRVGRRLQWDPQKEIFVGENDAPYLLDYPRRRGYQLPEAI